MKFASPTPSPTRNPLGTPSLELRGTATKSTGMSPIQSPIPRQLERKVARSRTSTTLGDVAFVRSADMTSEAPNTYPPTIVEASPITRPPVDPTRIHAANPVTRPQIRPCPNRASDQRSSRAGALRSASPTASPTASQIPNPLISHATGPTVAKILCTRLAWCKNAATNSPTNPPASPTKNLKKGTTAIPNVITPPPRKEPASAFQTSAPNTTKAPRAPSRPPKSPPASPFVKPIRSRRTHARTRSPATSADMSPSPNSIEKWNPSTPASPATSPILIPASGRGAAPDSFHQARSVVPLDVFGGRKERRVEQLGRLMRNGG